MMPQGIEWALKVPLSSNKCDCKSDHVNSGHILNLTILSVQLNLTWIRINKT